MKHLLIASTMFLFFSCVGKKSDIEPVMVQDSVKQVDWGAWVNHTMDSLRAKDVKGIEQTYINAWIDGANAVVDRINNHKSANSLYLTSKSIEDSTNFSNNFRKRNNLNHNQ